ncbi:MAG: TIGR01212 family radical SAM protein, partial [Spirochaetales bacterium]|nr:TIGR01212 family radical SAM protein [Spirochaetales bacterium]
MGARAAYLRTSESSFSHSSDFESSIDSMSQKMNNSSLYSFKFEKEDIKAQVDRGVEFVRRRYKTDHFSAYLQSFSNTFAPLDRLKELYDYV